MVKLGQLYIMWFLPQLNINNRNKNKLVSLILKIKKLTVRGLYGLSEVKELTLKHQSKAWECSCHRIFSITLNFDPIFLRI